MNTEIAKEIWRTTPDYPQYAVSNYGQVMNLFIGKVLKQHPNYKGYLRVHLCNKDGSRVVRVARLACRAFHGEPLPGQRVRHLNCCNQDDRAVNLAWGTQEEDYQDSIRCGTKVPGGSSQSFKLPEVLG